MGELTNAAKARRRRNWIVALSLPGYLALTTFGLMAVIQSADFDPAEWLTLIALPVVVVGVLSWALGPFFSLISLVMFLWDLSRRDRRRRERVLHIFVVLGSVVAWILSNLINDAYHLLR